MKSRQFLVIMALVAASLTAGCNTMHGAGEDIERGGEKIQEQSR
ncbi:entericidin [Bordetella genomosp. 4]|uniref:Entericidin n=1 Tax=Bordetella genomosp. 4 TaxID=463044 RepID=A0A261U0H8_9BORD|nr:entericidin [Bordetella genomosp. 4]OZI54740.1 entericidin [Bordetella genomosp. 4]